MEKIAFLLTLQVNKEKKFIRKNYGFSNAMNQCDLNEVNQ